MFHVNNKSPRHIAKQPGRREFIFMLSLKEHELNGAPFTDLLRSARSNTSSLAAIKQIYSLFDTPLLVAG